MKATPGGGGSWAGAGLYDGCDSYWEDCTAWGMNDYKISSESTRTKNMAKASVFSAEKDCYSEEETLLQSNSTSNSPKSPDALLSLLEDVSESKERAHVGSWYTFQMLQVLGNVLVFITVWRLGTAGKVDQYGDNPSSAHKRSTGRLQEPEKSGCLYTGKPVAASPPAAAPQFAQQSSKDNDGPFKGSIQTDDENCPGGKLVISATARPFEGYVKYNCKNEDQSRTDLRQTHPLHGGIQFVRLFVKDPA